MAQRQIKPPERTTVEQIIEQMREIIDTVRDMRVPFTPPQREQMRRYMEEMNQLLQQTQTTQPAGSTPTSPQARTTPAPRRVEQFVYDVSLHGRTYRVALAEPLPTLRGGGVDVAAAQRRLHDLLLNNQLVRRENPNDPASPVIALAQVTMPGTGREEQRYNSGTPNQRLDLFRDAYLGVTYRDGRYVQSDAVRIAEVPQPATGRRM